VSKPPKKATLRSVAKRRPDWGKLRELAESFTSKQHRDELAPAWGRGEIPEPLWAPEYVWALQQAIEQHDSTDLLSLLDARRLIHPALLPGLAMLLRMQGKSGRSIKLLEVQQHQLRQMYEASGLKRELFREQWAKLLGVSEATIDRAIRKRSMS
jgi:hypothetical protein